MTDTAKVLGQASPAASILADAYAVPAVTSVIISTIKCCNRDINDTTIRVSIAKAGVADAPAQYVYYDLPLEANDTFSATEGWTLATGDVIRVYSANGLVSFNIFGAEIT